MPREALYVGIDYYQDPGRGLTRCETDARDIARLLAQNHEASPVGIQNWTPASRAVLSSAHQAVVSEAAINREITKALRAARAGDFLFFFAGHGVPTQNGLLLASADDNPAGERKGVYVRDLLEKIESSNVTSATIILDCCYAGLATQETLSAGVCILASTGPNDLAREPGMAGHSAFAQLLLEGLGAAADGSSPSADPLGQITALSLFSFISTTMDLRSDGQNPVFAGRVERPTPLRWAKGAVSLDDLRRLVDPPFVLEDGRWVPGESRMFPESTAKFELEPDHEAPDGRDRDKDVTLDDLNPKQLEMEYFKRLRNAGLAVFDSKGGLPDLYHAVKNRGVAKLTASGQYFWRAVTEDRLKVF